MRNFVRQPGSWGKEKWLPRELSHGAAQARCRRRLPADARTDAPIWAESIKNVVELPQYSDTHEFSLPEDLQVVNPDKKSNLLGDEACTDSHDTAFLDGTAPTETCAQPTAAA